MKNLPKTSNNEEVFIINNPYAGLDEPRQWICKGKHQYREKISHNNGKKHSDWICQCGKYLPSKTS